MLLKPIGGSGQALTVEEIDGAPSVASVIKIKAPDRTITDNGGGVVTLDYIRSPLTANLDFATFKAIAMACDNGGTLPTTPVVGQWFLHTPTGRKILMQYDGANWLPIMSMGAMTVYVDGTSGTDDPSKGTGTGVNAFRTVQYAVNSIPGLVGGNVIINTAGGVYAEDVVVRGKRPTGNYTITLQGTLTVLDSLTAGVGSVQGGFGVQGTVVRSSGTWTANQRQHKLCRFTSGANNGSTRLINSNDATTLTIINVWNGGAPASGDAFMVEDWDTQIRSIALDGQMAFIVNDVFFNATSGFVVDINNYSSATFNRCRTEGRWTIIRNASVSDFIDCFFNNSAIHAVVAQIFSSGIFMRGKTTGWADGNAGIQGNKFGSLLLVGHIVDGITPGSRKGVWCVRNSFAEMSLNVTYYGSTYVYNNSIGVYCTVGSLADQTAGVSYAGNTTNENPTGATDPNYID